MIQACIDFWNSLSTVVYEYEKCGPATSHTYSWNQISKSNVQTNLKIRLMTCAKRLGPHARGIADDVQWLVLAWLTIIIIMHHASFASIPLHTHTPFQQRWYVNAKCKFHATIIIMIQKANSDHCHRGGMTTVHEGTEPCCVNMISLMSIQCSYVMKSMQMPNAICETQHTASWLTAYCQITACGHRRSNSAFMNCYCARGYSTRIRLFHYSLLQALWRISPLRCNMPSNQATPTISKREQN